METEAVQKRSRRAVIAYSTSLIIIVLFFIGLSYFIDRRGDHALDALQQTNSSAMTKIESLQTENIEMRKELDSLRTEIARLEDELAHLEVSEKAAKSDYDELLKEYNTLLSSIEAEDTENTEGTEND